MGTPGTCTPGLLARTDLTWAKLTGTRRASERYLPVPPRSSLLLWGARPQTQGHVSLSWTQRMGQTSGILLLSRKMPPCVLDKNLANKGCLNAGAQEGRCVPAPIFSHLPPRQLQLLCGQSHPVPWRGAAGISHRTLAGSAVCLENDMKPSYLPSRGNLSPLLPPS